MTLRLKSPYKLRPRGSSCTKALSHKSFAMGALGDKQNQVCPGGAEVVSRAGSTVLPQQGQPREEILKHPDLELV